MNWHFSSMSYCIETFFLCYCLYNKQSLPVSIFHKTCFNNLVPTLWKWSLSALVITFSGNSLQFEWAWQHPHISRRLSHVTRRTRKESSLQFHWRVLSNMLRVAPWNRLPLTVRWLRQEYRLDFEPHLQPPLHIPLTFGCVRAKKKRQQDDQEQPEIRLDRCLLCRDIVQVCFC